MHRLFEVMPCQVYCTHKVAVTWSKFHLVRCTAHIQWQLPSQGYTLPGVPPTHSGGYPVKVTPCQVYRTHTVAVTGHGYTLPGVPHTYSGGYPVKVTPCQVYRTRTVAVTQSRLQYYINLYTTPGNCIAASHTVLHYHNYLASSFFLKRLGVILVYRL